MGPLHGVSDSSKSRPVSLNSLIVIMADETSVRTNQAIRIDSYGPRLMLLARHAVVESLDAL